MVWQHDRNNDVKQIEAGLWREGTFDSLRLKHDDVERAAQDSKEVEAFRYDVH